MTNVRKKLLNKIIRPQKKSFYLHIFYTTGNLKTRFFIKKTWKKNKNYYTSDN